MLGEVILKELCEGNSLVTAKAPVVPSDSLRHLIQRPFDPAHSHWTTLVVFASTLAVWTGKLVSVWCIGEKSQ